MKFKRIFTQPKTCRLWAVCYPEDCKRSKSTDIFQKLMNQWDDTEYLTNFFLTNQELLFTPFWGKMSIDDAINQVMEESHSLESELYNIENNHPSAEGIALSDIFKPLHSHIFSITFKQESFRKAKANFRRPMIRLYAIKLDDETLVITGGVIKLTSKMNGKIFDDEMAKLNKVKDYLHSQGITDEIGLQ